MFLLLVLLRVLLLPDPLLPDLVSSSGSGSTTSMTASWWSTVAAPCLAFTMLLPRPMWWAGELMIWLSYPYSHSHSHSKVHWAPTIPRDPILWPGTVASLASPPHTESSGCSKSSSWSSFQFLDLNQTSIVVVATNNLWYMNQQVRGKGVDLW